MAHGSWKGCQKATETDRTFNTEASEQGILLQIVLIAQCFFKVPSASGMTVLLEYDSSLSAEKVERCFVTMNLH